MWYKYVYIEELLGSVPGTRQVFERSMKRVPDDKAWQAYIKMEERYQEHRVITNYDGQIAARPEPMAW